MALTNNGTLVSLPDSKLPVGFVAPAVTTFDDYEYLRQLVLDIPKTSVENADKNTTLLNIIQDAVVGIEKQVNDFITVDFGTNTGQYYVEFYGLISNVAPSATTDFLNNNPVNYVVAARVYAKTDL